MSKKVVLFFPSPLPYNRAWKGVPLALLAISRLLDKEGYEVKIITRFTHGSPEKEVILQSKDAICLGISAMTGFQIKDGLKISSLVKKRYPKLPIVWGGWHPSILPIQTVKNKNVDIVVRGQGDVSFYELVKALEGEKKLDDIAGLVYKQKGKVVVNKERRLEDINHLPPLPYHLVDVERCISGTEYGERTLPYISSYGCPHRCGFCVEQIVNKRGWVASNARNLVREWAALVKKYQLDSIAVYDSNFFVDKERVYKICCSLIRQKINIKWGNANGRVPQLVKYEEKIWKVMKESGCAMILTGAESGSQDALDLIEKDMDVGQIAKFTRLCKKYKIKILYSFLVGLPWSKNLHENKKFIDKEYSATLGLIDKLLKISKRNRFTYYVFLPYPGAPLFDRAVKLGLKTPKTLRGWSQYLVSPEDAFNTGINQKWITSSQARMTAMLTQYIFGLMDEDTFDVLKERTKSKFSRIVFIGTYTVAQILVKIRWRLKYFGLPIDYRLFTLVHKYGKLV